MAKEKWYVSKLEQILAGTQLIKGQLVKPTGARNDKVIFGENTRWVYEFNGQPVSCDTDGCPARFTDERSLAAHRLKVHAPERDARIQSKVDADQSRARFEAEGQTIGGRPVDRVKAGPGGPVPYIK